MNQNAYQKTIRLLTWLIPISLAICLMPLTGTGVSPDGSGYLAQGLNFYHGNGYTYADGSLVTFRGPMFPWLLSVSFYLFGLSAYSAMLMVRIFFVLNIAVVYLWGRKIGGDLAGMIASLLVLTAFSLHQWSARIHLDIVLPFFILAATLALYYAFEKKRLWIFVCASLLLGVASLTKEFALLFAPLPILMWLLISNYRTRKNILYIFIYYLLLGLLVVPWLYRLVQDEEMLSTYLRTSEWVFRSGIGTGYETAPPTADRTTSQPNPSAFTTIFSLISLAITLFAERLKTFYSNFLAEGFMLAPLFVLAWTVTLTRSLIERNKDNLWLLLSLLCFMPIVLFLGSVSYRAGQAHFFYLLSYIALAYQLVALFRRMRLPSLSSLPILILLLGIQIWVGDTRFSQLFTHQDLSGYVASSRSYSFSFFKDQWTVSNWHNKPIIQAGQWLHKNVAADEPILSDWQWLESYYFYAEAKQPVYEIEYLSSQVQRNPSINISKPIRFLWTQAGRTDPSAVSSNVLAFSEQLFLSQVKELDIKYIIFGQRRNFLALYLHFHPSFIQVAEFDGGHIQIFEVIQNASLEQIDSFPLFTSSPLLPYLKALQKQRGPTEYAAFIQTYFIEELKLDGKQVQQIEANNQPKYRHNMIISPKRYASLISQADPALLLRAIQTQEEHAIMAPDNPWLQLSLASLYNANGQDELARSAFLQATSLAEGDSLVYPSLITAYRDLRKMLALDNITTVQFVESVQRLLEHHPDDIYSYWYLAEAYQLVNEKNKAMAVYEQALNRWPGSAGTMLRIAKYHQSRGQLAEAKSAYVTLLNLQSDEPNLPEPAEIHVEIGKILLATTEEVSQ